MADAGTPDLPDRLVRYLESRDQQHANAVNRALATLTPFERRLVREAAVMGYVRGTMAAKYRDDIPKDSAVTYEVVGACIAMDELYPYLAAASQGQRRRVTKSRRWPGELPRVRTRLPAPTTAQEES